MGYKYQLHTHTAPCSLCAQTEPRELAKALFEGGYAGCVLTNHFMCGNTGIDRALSWDKFIDAYEEDYLKCKSECEKYDLDVIFGIEEGVGSGLEILCYGITPDLLRAHPELYRAKAQIWYKTLHACGALVIQAHPFRKRAYISAPGALPLCYVDGIEVYNKGNHPEDNTEAQEFATSHPDLILTSGADSHRPDNLCVAGIETRVRIRDGNDLLRVLRSGDYTLIDG